MGNAQNSPSEHRAATHPPRRNPPHKPCLLGLNPAKSERCTPMDCKRCGWQRDEDDRRRKRIRAWDLAKGEFIRQIPGGGAGVLRLRYLKLPGGGEEQKQDG